MLKPAVRDQGIQHGGVLVCQEVRVGAGRVGTFPVKYEADPEEPVRLCQGIRTLCLWHLEVLEGFYAEKHCRLSSWEDWQG